MHFEEEYEPTLHQQTVVGSLGFFTKRGWNFHFSGGAILTGTMEGEGLSYDVEPGFLVSFRVGKSLIKQRGPIPFLNLSVSLSFSKTTITGEQFPDGSLIATDARLSGTVGYTLFDVWQLYFSPKLFGGPIFWEQGDDWVQGRDRYFFQLGFGTAFLLPKGFTLFVYGSPLGEQAISGGLAWAF